MKATVVLFSLLFSFCAVHSQEVKFTVLKNNPATAVKNQGGSGTCWCFSTTALIESELLLKKELEADLSETFTVYNLYLDKAEKYIRRRGNTRFAEGGLAQDMLYSADKFGVMPQEIYPGIGRDTIMTHNYAMADQLKAYLDQVIKDNPDTIPGNWKTGFKVILDSYLGAPPATFTYKGVSYTAKSFASAHAVVKPSDFIGLTSFTHHPFYESFIMEVPDNYNGNAYVNLPLQELIKTVRSALLAGYTLAWDTDVSNNGFRPGKGIAMWVNGKADSTALPAFTEHPYNQEIRQQLFDEQVTQDDHLMQITGLAKDVSGKEYFIVKNSYGSKSGPYGGYVYVSIPYFAINTISVVVDKNAVPAKLLISDQRVERGN